MNDEVLILVLDYLKIAGVIQLTFGLGVNVLNMLLGMVLGREKVRY